MREKCTHFIHDLVFTGENGFLNLNIDRLINFAQVFHSIKIDLLLIFGDDVRTEMDTDSWEYVTVAKRSQKGGRTPIFGVRTMDAKIQ